MSFKVVKRYIFGESIPSDATFLFHDQFNDRPLVYEVPEKQERKAPAKAMFQEEIIEAVVEHLNSKTGGQYTSKAKATVSHIRARLNEGRTLEDFKLVIDAKCIEWLEDPYWSKFLRPETLFAGKFDGYLSAACAAVGSNPFQELDKIMGGSDAK